MENLKSIEAKKIIRLYILLNTITTLSASFFGAIFFIFLKERGLSIPEMSAIVFMVMIITFILELPTGIIADVFGRKVSYVCSCFLMTLGLIVYAASNSFSVFLIAAALHAISSTLSSGAFQAWLVDSLKYNSCSTPLNVILVKEKQVKSSVGIVGVLLGSFLADINIMFPWIAGIFAMFMAGIIAAIFMKEEYFSKQKSSFAEGIKSAKKVIGTGVKYAKNNKAVKFVLLIGLLQSFAIQVPLIQYQLFFDQFLPNKTSLGFLWIAAIIFTIVGATLSSWLLRKMKNNHKKALVLSQTGIGAGILLSGIFMFPLSLFAFLFWKLSGGMFSPINDEYLNENIPAKSRATLISIISMEHSVGAGIGLIACSFMASYLSIPTMWTIMGGTLVVITLLLLRNGNNENKAI